MAKWLKVLYINVREDGGSLKVLWGLILCVSLTDIRDAQRASKKSYFWVLLEESKIRFSRLSKEIHLCQCRCYHSIHLRAQREQKRERRANSASLLELEWPPSALGYLSFSLLGLQTLGSTSTTAVPLFSDLQTQTEFPADFSVLQLADGRLQDFSTSVTVSQFFIYNLGPD